MPTKCLECVTKNVGFNYIQQVDKRGGTLKKLNRYHFFWLPFPSLGDFPDSGTEPGSPMLQADSLPSATRKAPFSG